MRRDANRERSPRAQVGKVPGGGLTILLASGGLLGYVTVGYPVAVALLARFRRRPIAADDRFAPTVSLIIAALDESAVIDQKLENSLELDYQQDRLEIVVVTDGSSDDTADRARLHSRTVVVHDPMRSGKASALSRGAAISKGEVLVFSDANNMLAPGALRELVSLLADPRVGCVTGRKAIDDGTGRPLDSAEGAYWRYEAAIRRWEGRFGSVSGVNGELLAIRRVAFAPLSPACVNDDFTMAMEAAISGWRIAYAENAISIEPASATSRDESLRRTRIAAGRWQALWYLGPKLARHNPILAWQVLSHKALRLAVPAATAGMIVGNVTAARRHRWAIPLLVAQGVFYSAAATGWRAERWGVRDRKLTYYPYYFCRMNVAMTAGLVQAVTRSSASLSQWERVNRG